MREILFRAKRTYNGEWVEGYYCKISETTYAFLEDYERNPIPVHHYILQETMIDWGLPNKFYEYEIDPGTLCQYTGLKDKNGKMIWENDILRRPYHPKDDCIVAWHDGRFNFQTIHGQYNQDPMTLLPICFVQKTADWLNVVGNIFDNPELMKEW